MGTLGWLLADYLALKHLAMGFQSAGFTGLAHPIVTLGPRAIGVVNEFVADLMASIDIVGFVPGGRAGLVIGTVISLAGNGAEIWFGIDSIKDRLGSRGRQRKSQPRGYSSK